ncbi:MAG: sodium-translocating pyrophosphatase [Candidatus Hadarchaeales archaeon]
MDYILLSVLTGVVALVYATIRALIILKHKVENWKMREISEIIYRGALTFLNQEYKIIVAYAIVVFAVLTWIDIKIAMSFLLGGLCSALAGNIGMRIATKANARTTEASKRSIGEGLSMAFASGLVMGMCVVGLGLTGLGIIYLLTKNVSTAVGFGFGASSIALFARVGGGIYTKSADMGADLVGKIEKKIPEDDPRNPAVIADNVGDNVGDVAGMGADLFESYVGSIISAITLGFVLGHEYVSLPFLYAAVGIICSIIGSFLVRGGKKADIGALHSAMNRGIFTAAILTSAIAFLLTLRIVENVRPFFPFLSGIIAGIIVGLTAEYYTESRFGPTRRIAEASKTGAATNLLTGFSTGMMSVFIPVITISAALLISYQYQELYGIAIAGVGMLSTLGITLAADCYGPVADNAAGIAQMTGAGQEVRDRTEKLDAVGNTTAAIGKGFAIGSAALTALALFAAYVHTMREKGFQLTLTITEPDVVAGLFIGGALPFLFCALTMSAVGKGAYMMVEEVRRQFRDPAIMSGKKKPDYNRCITISTRVALRNMTLPASIAVLSPIILGLLLGPESVAGLLAGSTTVGLMLALTLANSGGAWDNAKKYIEEGNFGGKGSDAHAAAVVGDTVGDPFKDTAGPSLNILIKLMAMTALLFLPHIL